MSHKPRRAVRLKVLFETLYCSNRQEGEAVLTDVSRSGALLDSATKPVMGARVMLYVHPANGGEPVELRGKVARHTSDGFAIYYDKPSPDVVRLVDDEAAIGSLVREEIVGVLESTSTGNPESEAGLVEETVEGALIEAVPVADVLMADIPTGTEPLASAAVSPVAGVPVGGAPMLLSELDLGPYSISEIEALLERIPEVIASKRAEAKQRVLQKIKKLAELEGFSLEELLEKP